MSENEAWNWPDLMRILEEKVKPSRLAQKRERRAKYWWQFGETSPGLKEAIRGLARVLVHPFTSPHLAFAFVNEGTIVASPHVVFALDSYASFGTLQSRIHEVWARFFSSSFKDDLRYTASNCFDTFPGPREWMFCPSLGSIGKAYYEFRAALMIRNDEGLTKTYNRFHAPDERNPEILKLRELHAAMDRAVLDAYGWSDISTDCEFLLDYEIDEEEWGKKKKPWRYRWPDEVRGEILARLLELNAERAKEEVRSGAAAAPKKRRKKATRRSPQASGMKDLFS